MPDEAELITGVIPARPKPNKRRARARFDGRYALGRRAKTLTAEFSARVIEQGGNPDDALVAIEIMNCAEVTALAEVMRGRLLNGEQVNAETVLRLSRTSDLLTRKLLGRKPRAAPGPSLAQYLSGAERGDVVSQFFCDGYTDKPRTRRGVLEHEIERLKMLSWADPADKELREEIERLQQELRRLDATAGGRP
jgi:hypothetical protein